jgi:SAM-dependent methyltransferase
LPGDLYEEEGMPIPPAPHDVVVTLMDGYIQTQLLYVAARLRLADLLASGPQSAPELAAAAGVNVSVLHRILRGLAINGIVEEGQGVFGLTEAGRCLQSGTADSLRGAVLSRGDLYYRAASGLLEAAQDGGSAFRHVYGAEFFDHLSTSPDRLVAFQQSMVARSQLEVEEVLRAYDFSPYHHVVDVGAGFGVTLAAILRTHTDLHGTLFDLPDVAGAAQQRLESADVAARCRVVGGDAFRSVPQGGDLYLLSRVIHDWDDESAVRILRSCRTAMNHDGSLVLVEAVIPDRATDQPAAILMDLHMLVLGLGKERTIDEFSGLLARADFALRRVIPTQGRTGVNLLEARCV